MLDPAIKEFFDQRKELWLKSNIKIDDSKEKRDEVKQACEKIFDLSEGCLIRKTLDDSISRILVLLVIRVQKK